MMLDTLVTMEDTQFLKALVAYCPEAVLLAGEAESSPEGSQRLKETALAYQVFEPSIRIHETAIEADRTFLGLKLFKAAHQGDREKFPHLSDQNWRKLSHLTQEIVASDDDLDVILYALIAQDIGKTKALSELYKDVFGVYAEDHDRLLHELTRKKSELFKGFLDLSPDNQKAYLEGLESDMNLGQFVQGENLPCNIIKMLHHTDDRAKRIRLLTELYDFAGVTGHINHHVSLTMNDHNYKAYNHVIQLMLAGNGDVLSLYQAYMQERLDHVGISSTRADWFALARITALSRSFDVEKGQEILSVWQELPQLYKEILIKELLLCGLSHDEPTACLIYYAPALIVNSIHAHEEFNAGLRNALCVLAEIYKKARTEIDISGVNKDFLTVHINQVARYAREHKIIHENELELKQEENSYIITIKKGV